MLDRQLRIRLGPLAKRVQLMELWRCLGVGWMVAFFSAFAVYWMRSKGVEKAWEFWPLACVLGIAVGATGFAFCRFLMFRVDYLDLIQKLIGKHPEARTLLQTAIEQRPLKKGEPLNYFQNRLLEEAIDHAKVNDWKNAVETKGLLYRSSFSLWMGCAYFFIVLQILLMPEYQTQTRFQEVARVEEEKPAQGVPKNLPTVDPGDVELESGSSLLITATFPEQPSFSPVLKLAPDSTVEQSFSMTRSLDDPIFAVRIPRIDHDNAYRIEHPDGATENFKITTYTHPVLIQADALIHPPEYTGLSKRELEDVRTFSIAEGAEVQLRFTLNKQVDKAYLVHGKDPFDTLTTDPHPQDVTIYQLTFTPEKSASYRLHLKDSDGRTNKLPPRFQINVLPNKPPIIQTQHPRGDVQASSLQELGFQAKITDDYGLQAYGFTYQLPGQEPKEIHLHQKPDAKPQSAFHLLPLEELNLVPDDLVTWHFWAEDRASDGTPRRVHADLHFAEIRPFEHIYREGVPQEGESPPGAQKTAEKLAKSQKMIISATWNLLHERSKVESFSEDVNTIMQSQAELLKETEQSIEQFDDPVMSETLGKAVEFMQQAVDNLLKSKDSEERKQLNLALSPEQSAYAQLLKTRAREFQIMQSQQGKGQGRSNNSEQQQQLDNLDLKEKEQRYETADQANSQEDAEKREDRQALNRLRELAKRQQDLNEKIKDLNAAMHETQEPQKEEDLQNQLKRLREQQRELLSDLDELQNRLQKQENRDRTQQAQKQLQQTRQQMNQASKALEQEQLSQAQNATSRAQKELNELKDEYRKKVAGEFADDMRKMRGEAKDLEEQQKDILKHLNKQKEKTGKRLTDKPADQPLADRAKQQLDRTEKLLEQMKEVTQKAEESEPLLSRKLYESLRNQPTEKLKEDLSVSSDLLKRHFIPQAKEPLENAATTLSGLKQDIDEAAKHVLGDPKESLHRAKQQVEDLKKQVKDEVAQNTIQEGKSQEEGNPQGENSDGKGEESSGEDSKGVNQQQAGKSQDGKSTNGEGKPSDREDPNGKALASKPTDGKSQDSKSPQSSQETAVNGEGGNSPSEQEDPKGTASKPSQGKPSGSPSESPSESAAQDGKSPGKASNKMPPIPGLSGNQTQEQGFGTNTGGPMTGEDYLKFSDQLRDLEEMIESPQLRNKAARIRDKARSIRKDFKRHGKEPQWDQVIDDVLNPLVELHEELDEELRKLETDQPTQTPIDRDPVPQRYSDLVKQYYDELAK